MNDKSEQKKVQDIEDFYNGLIFLAEDNNSQTILFGIGKFIVNYFMTIDDEEFRTKATASIMTKIGLPLCCGVHNEARNYYNEFNNDIMFILKKYQHEISQGNDKE